MARLESQPEWMQAVGLDGGTPSPRWALANAACLTWGLTSSRVIGQISGLWATIAERLVWPLEVVCLWKFTLICPVMLIFLTSASTIVIVFLLGLILSWSLRAVPCPWPSSHSQGFCGTTLSHILASDEHLQCLLGPAYHES